MTEQVEPTLEVAPLDVLFILRNLPGYLRFFGGPLELLARRGHRVCLLVAEDDAGEVERAWLGAMGRYGNFNYVVADHLSGSRWYRVARDTRRALDYLRYLAPEFGARPIFRQRSEHRAPELVKRLVSLPGLRSAVGVVLLRRALLLVDRAVPRPAEAGAFLDSLHPDLVALCDHGIAGSLQSTYIEEAQARGIPTALCVASWDNLSTRQRIPVQPDKLVVWNEWQVEEAAETHGIDRSRVVVTGAQGFDHWFSWRPRSREEFCRRVGLRADRPFVLWVGGALSPTERTEAELALEWARQLRESADPRLAELGVLLRPHPLRVPQWRAVDFGRVPGAAVWPRERMSMPTDEEQRADYFDSIYHSEVVVGINSSAMIEAAIVGRPVLALVTDDFAASHVQTFHFSYLSETEGGVVRLRETIEEHLEALGALLGGEDPTLAERNAEFVRRFVRPHGLDREATPIFVETLEELGRTSPKPRPTPWWIRSVRPAVVAAIGFGEVATDTGKARKRLRRRLRKLPLRVYSLGVGATRRVLRSGARVLQSSRDAVFRRA